MKRTYHGSCHCGAVRFECDIDLALRAADGATAQDAFAYGGRKVL